MKEPGARVVRLEANCHVVRGVITDGHDVANNRVVPVVGRVAGTANDPEVVTVQVHRVRATARATGHDDVDDSIRLQLVDAALRHELRSAGVATQDLQKNRDRRSRVCNVVDGKASSIIL